MRKDHKQAATEIAGLVSVSTADIGVAASPDDAAMLRSSAAAAMCSLDGGKKGCACAAWPARASLPSKNEAKDKQMKFVANVCGRKLDPALNVPAAHRWAVALVLPDGQ